MKKIAVTIFAVILLCSLCSCTQKSNESMSEIDFTKLSWNKNTEQYEENSLKYFYQKSSDGKYAWIDRLEVKDEYKGDKLEFPDEINGSVLVRIGFDVGDVTENESNIPYNVFGSTLTDDFKYPQKFKNIQNIVLPDSIQAIEDGAFAGLYSMKNINCPKELRRIGVGAFNLCSGITEFTIGEYVSEIGPGAFGNCERLRKIHVSANNKKFCEQGGFIVDKEQKQAILAVPGKEELVIPNDVNSFRKKCFATCKVKKLDLESEESGLVKKGDFIYRKDNKALLLGIVNGKTAIIPEGIEELNQESVLIGEKINKIEMPSGLKYLRGAWLDIVDADDCTYVFRSKNPPKIVEPSESTSKVPVGQNIVVPKQSFEKYEKWLKSNGGELNLLKTF